ncbi:MAG: AtpZ/AtpI family protein [Candidatus Omnitrophica bacterium]|nr:AtpZ/AtpI family protein [Candidatus Omnitrophota bacterium]
MNRQGTWVKIGVFTSIPMVLAGGPTLGFLIGRFLDRRFSSDPWGVFFFVLAGLVAGVVETIRLIQRAQENKSSSKNDDP